MFKIVLTVSAVLLGTQASPLATGLSWNAVVGSDAELFHSGVNSIQSKSLDTAVLVGELNDLLEQNKVLNTVYGMYLTHYNKEASRFHTLSARAQFKKNLLEIAQHNLEAKQGKFAWTEGVNQFTDMSDAEYSQYLTFTESFEDFFARANISMAEQTEFTKPVADGVSWRAQTTPVKNQGSCGSCYAFGTIGQLEANYNINHGQVFDLSEQQVVDCSGQGGCHGGENGKTAEWLKNGVADEASYPYTSGKTKEAGPCQSVAPAGPAFLKMTRLRGEEGIESAISEGTVAVAMCASYDGFKRYKSGVLTQCCDKLSHALLAVAYGTDADSGLPYWELKNSWATSYGDQGFVKLQKGVNLCGVGKQATAAQAN